MGELLRIDHVSYSYHSLEGETPALQDVSLHVNDGEFLAIVGPSGCGKSTLLSLIAGLISPDTGGIYINNKDIKSSGKNIGYMLQKDHLLEWRSTLRNLTLGLEIQHKLTENSYVLINDMLTTYGLITFKNARPSELSGGMRQRAALIRTLLLEPDILLLDEPFSALDYQTRIEVSDDIWSIIRKEKKTAILITHDISEAILTVMLHFFNFLHLSPFLYKFHIIVKKEKECALCSLIIEDTNGKVVAVGVLGITMNGDIEGLAMDLDLPMDQDHLTAQDHPLATDHLLATDRLLADHLLDQDPIK